MANKLLTRVACISHMGCVRNNNEDNFFLNGDMMLLTEMDQGACICHSFSKAQQLFAVCDGMGGAKLGERASAIAAKGLNKLFSSMPRKDFAQEVEQYARSASKAIKDDCIAHHADHEGTTLALFALTQGAVYSANVGDSRVYRLRRGELKQLTSDHSLVNEMRMKNLLTAEQARKSPRNNIITRYLGMAEKDIPKEFVYFYKSTLEQGDRYLLCSDGLCDLMSDTTIEQELARDPDPAVSVRRLVTMALELGGKDNVTCMVVDIERG